MKLEYDIGRSPGSQVFIAGPAFPAFSASGVRGARLTVHSCGGSPGIGDIGVAAPDSLFIPSGERQRGNLIVNAAMLSPPGKDVNWAAAAIEFVDAALHNHLNLVHGKRGKIKRQASLTFNPP